MFLCLFINTLKVYESTLAGFRQLTSEPFNDTLSNGLDNERPQFFTDFSGRC